MKILLVAVNAKYIHSNLAVYSLKAAARAYGDRVEIGEYTVNQQLDEILADIYQRQPEVAAFSCYIWNRKLIGELLKELPKILPGVELWVGGPEVSYAAEDFLREHPMVSVIMRGEGEGTFRSLAARYIEGEGSLEDIDGLAFRGKDGEICRTKDASAVDLDDIPFPYEGLGDFEHKIVYYESSRGCPFCCSYCLSSIEKGVRFRSMERVKRELSLFLEAGLSQVKFVDRTFNCDSRRALEIWRWLAEHDNGATNFHFEIAADLITPEELELMGRMRPGLIQLEIGVQSTNPSVIRRVGRRMDFRRLSAAVERIRGLGNIHQHLDLIAGLPGEDLESFRTSFDEVFALRPEQLQLGFLKLLKGTRLCGEAQNYGILCHSAPPYEVLSTDWISYEEILELKGVEEMVEVYYNSHQFDRTLGEILKRYLSPFAFFHELAVYYREEGYSRVSHSRMARYEILRRFLKGKGWTEEVYDQCMIYDLYAREKLKSRPAFAQDQSPFQEKLRRFTKVYGKQVHVEVFIRKDGPLFVLFDYGRRNPLTGEAHTEVLEA